MACNSKYKSSQWIWIRSSRLWNCKRKWNKSRKEYCRSRIPFHSHTKE